MDKCRGNVASVALSIAMQVAARHVTFVFLLASAVLAQGAASGSAPYTGPIIDVHLHAFAVNVQGPPPVGVCVGEAANLAFDAQRPWPETLINLVKKPHCAKPFWSPTTDEALRVQTLAEMKRLHIVGVVSGPPERVLDYLSHAPNSVIPGLEFNMNRFKYTLLDLQKLFERDGFKVLGEVTDQYDGIAPDDARFDDIRRFAAEHDVPVAIHLGVGPPGAPYISAGYRAHLHSPFSLEKMLVRHPHLRVYAMHAAWPMLDELKAMLYSYPQLYVDTGSLQMALTRTEYYSFLKNLVDAGFVDRIMYGTDQIVWPGLIAEGIHAINDAPFLTAAQKQDILHDNAVRFFRLK